MGHDYSVPLRFLSVTPTRDNDVAPGNRLADKHARLFHGKTLDEWLMIQLWSSKYLGRAIFVCETGAHRDKLKPLADKYNISLMVRPRDMLHPINDTGALPIMYGLTQALYSDYYSLFTSPLVVSPCRPPGFFDFMVDTYAKMKAGSPDFDKAEAWVMGGCEVEGAMFELDENRVGHQQGTVYLNRNPLLRYSETNHWMAATWFYTASRAIAFSRHDVSFKPTFFDIEPWQDIHIDTQDHWDQAEYWFAKKILSQGEDCYERYRQSWGS